MFWFLFSIISLMLAFAVGGPFNNGWDGAFWFVFGVIMALIGVCLDVLKRKVK